MTLSGLALTTCATQAGTDFRLEVGPELNAMQYREPGLIKENGFLYGGFASGTAIVKSNLVLNLRASLAAGTLRYDGQTMEGEPASMDTPNRLFTLLTSLGYHWNPVTPFAGIGLRDWNDNLGANSPYGYNRQTTYLYSPLGLEISRAFGNAWTLGARAEFDLFWAGINRNTDFPIEGNETITLHQHSGYGAQLSIFVHHPMTRSLGLMVESFFQYWNIGRSEQVYILAPDGLLALYEPANETSLLGLRGGLRW